MGFTPSMDDALHSTRLFCPKEGAKVLGVLPLNLVHTRVEEVGPLVRQWQSHRGLREKVLLILVF